MILNRFFEAFINGPHSTIGQMLKKKTGRWKQKGAGGKGSARAGKPAADERLARVDENLVTEALRDSMGWIRRGRWFM